MHSCSPILVNITLKNYIKIWKYENIINYFRTFLPLHIKACYCVINYIEITICSILFTFEPDAYHPLHMYIISMYISVVCFTAQSLSYVSTKLASATLLKTIKEDTIDIQFIFTPSWSLRENTTDREDSWTLAELVIRASSVYKWVLHI